MIDLHASTIVMRYYDGPEDTEVDGLVATEVNEGEIDLIVHPRTSDAHTFSFSIEQAWRLSRELAKAATVAELGLDGN